MALSWGGWTPSINGQSFRLGIDIWYTGDPNSGSVTVWGAYRIASTAPVGDDQTLNLSGNFSGSVGFRNNGGEFEIWRGSKVISTQYGSAQWIVIGGWVTGIYNGASPSHDAGITVPARAYSTPYAPPAASVARVSDTSQKVSWTTNYTSASGARPWTGVYIERWDNVSNAYTRVKTASWSETTWTDTGTVANRRYRYRIQSYNQAGASGFTYTGYIYTVPAAPASAAVARTSDTQHTVSWGTGYAGSSGGGYSWVGVKVERWDNVSNAWSQITAVPGVTTRSYSDKTTVVDRRYRYRVRSYNDTGNSGYIYTDFVKTTPNAPSNITATKNGSDIVVGWTDNSSTESGFEVWHAANGVWDATRLAVVGADIKSYTHSTPDTTKTHTYRLKAYAAETGQTTLYSGYSPSSNVVQLLTPPNAPSKLAPSGSVIDAIASPPVLTWQHNPLDTTAQTSYQVRRREVGAPTWNTGARVYSTVSAADTSLWQDPFQNGKVYEWEVQTWGQHANPSGFSSTATFSTSARPTASIQSPSEGSPWDISTLAVDWSFYDEEGSAQVEWKATLYADNGSTVLESVQRLGEDGSYTFTRRVANETTYVVGVSARDDAGLWSVEDRRTIRVIYALPTDPSFVGTFMPNEGQVVVAISNPDQGLDISTSYNEVWRSADPETARLLRLLETAREDAAARGLAVPRRNLAPTPRLTQDTDGSTIADGWSAYSRSAPLDGWSVSEAGQRLAGTFTTAGQRLGVRLDLDTMRPGGFYTVSVDVTIDNPAARYFLYMEQLLPGDVYAYLGEFEITDSGRFSATDISPTSEAVGPVMMYLWAQGDADGTSYDVTFNNVLIEEGEELRPFFDGDTPDTSNTDYGWEGTPHASVSIAADTTMEAALNAFEQNWDETAVLVATKIPPNSSTTDFIPGIGHDNVYRVVAYSDLPSSTETDPVIVTTLPELGWAFLNGGPQFSQVVRIRAELNISPTFSRDKVLNKFAGRKFPVPTVGEGRNRTIEISAKIRPTHRPQPSTPSRDIEALADLSGAICYRDPIGHRYFVSIDEVSPDYKSISEAVSISMTQVDYNG